MRIAICDDENIWINYIEGYIMRIKKIYPETEYDFFTSGEELLNYYRSNGNVFDIIILDIEMKSLSGIETAQTIRDMDSTVIIFFLTSHKEYVYDCFRPAPMNFWVKPVSYEIFKEDIRRAYSCIKKSTAYIKIVENRKKIRLRCNDIIYIEIIDRKSYLHTTSGIYTTNKLLSDLMKELDNKLFVRIYKSFIINMKYVHIIGESTVSLYHSDAVIPIGRTYKNELTNKYINLKESENF